ncbi:MAG: hypothetical protein ABSB68_01830 [Acidimicrobiales bacterium]|jgi:hypothetical protein
MTDYDPQVFDGGSWVAVGAMAFTAICGIGFLGYAKPVFVLLGAVLLVVGVTGLIGFLGSRHLEVSDAGVTTRRFFHWTHTYPRSDIHHASSDWTVQSVSVPLLVLNNGRQIRLWGVSRATLFPFRNSKHTAEIVTAINLSLGYQGEAATQGV